MGLAEGHAAKWSAPAKQHINLLNDFGPLLQSFSAMSRVRTSTRRRSKRNQRRSKPFTVEATRKHEIRREHKDPLGSLLEPREVCESSEIPNDDDSLDSLLEPREVFEPSEADNHDNMDVLFEPRQ